MASKNTSQDKGMWLIPITHQDFYKSVVCPFCGCENIHLHQPSSGMLGRGSFVEVAFSCESGCYWTLRFNFHKGTCFVKLETVPLEEPFAFPKPETWRD
jgi:hypothetical protein